MAGKEYTAGTVKVLFWFIEYKKFVKLLMEGNTPEVIKKMSEEENVFGASSQARAKQIYSAVSKRIQVLNREFLDIFVRGDLSTQKIITLCSLLETDRLFFEFVYEVYREKLILGSTELTDSDFSIFFKRKQEESSKIAEWKDYTLKKLSTCYAQFLCEAGLIENVKGNKKILKPLLDIDLENCLRKYEKEHILRALTGVD